MKILSCPDKVCTIQNHKGKKCHHFIIKTELHFDELLKVAGQLNMRKLEQLMSQVISLRAKRKSPCLSQKETALFLKINKGLPSKTGTCFDVLNKKRQAETLTASEYNKHKKSNISNN